MALPGLVCVRLDAFKSHRGQALRFEPLTLIVGRNASGKSNALDALSLLALLADERDVNDLERGDQEVAGLRGGLSGAAPFGADVIRVGCTIETADEERLHLDVVLEASGRPEVVSEKLVLKRKTGRTLVLLDGHRTLRYLAIVASLLSLRREQPSATIPVRRTLVVEEIENGLFPSQGARVLELLRNEARAQGVRLIATTHSPALLDALEPADHAGVMICDRGADGWSRLRRLVDHPQYVEAAGGGTLGRAVTQGILEELPPRSGRSIADLLA